MGADIIGASSWGLASATAGSSSTTAHDDTFGTNAREPGTGYLHLSSGASSSPSSSSTLSNPTHPPAVSTQSTGSPSSTSLPRPHPHARFTTTLASYPLKLLTPTPLPSQPRNVGVVYTLAYGGGLVAGDTISLSVRIEEGCGLVMLTQGSTKVFKRRAGIRPLSHFRPNAPFAGKHAGDGGAGAAGGRRRQEDDLTRQRLHVDVKPGGLLLLLPDSISPFAHSKYAQAQRFVLPADGSGSALVLDWVNSGRGQRSTRRIPASHSIHEKGNAAPGTLDQRREDNDGGRTLEKDMEREQEQAEIWSMDRYASTNEILIGDRLIMRERMVLDNSNSAFSPHSHPASALSTTALQLAPYNIYASLLIVGPHLLPFLDYLKMMTDKIRQYQLSRPPGLIWSFSAIGEGGVLRVAAEQVEDARTWLRGVMKAGGVDRLVGEGLWPRVI